DLRRRFGQKEIKPSKKNRILVAEAEGKLVGLVVDSASEVMKIPENEIELPPVFDQSENNYVTGLGKLNGKLVILIDLNKILQKGELRRLGEIAEAQTTAASV
ncbi:MAG TPA: chemotaxis protein CheW, partial [Candidatus Sulfotelmatobacter sp.]|nr:chemotaxis protein CheW [Candidatus Sulfotelmatobacter sp.]